MGDFLLNHNDSGLGLDASINGIPIPRNQYSQQYMCQDYQHGLQIDHDCGSPAVSLIAPPNSLVGMGPYNSWSSQENSHNISSPLSCTSPLMPSNLSDIDMEVKMEPADLDILEIGRTSNTSAQIFQDLLDDVNFEDLLMTDEMDNSTTCLDPQHSSPAAMATVHPDEVLGLSRLDSGISSEHSFTPSISVPRRSDVNLSASSFPPQSIGWKDPFLTVMTSNSYVQNQARHHPCIKEQPQSKFFPSLPQATQEQGLDIKAEPSCMLSQSETSTLHDLLVNSPMMRGNVPSPLIQEHSSPHQSIPSEKIPVGQSVPGPSSFLNNSSMLSSRLSSSAPVNGPLLLDSLDHVWQRRESRPHRLSTGTLSEEVGGSTSSLSTGGGILSPASHDLSIEENETDEDSDAEHYDSDSDNDSIRSEETSSGNRRERHFWQYNVQAKGPKGQRVNIARHETNPHRLEEVMDPVFSPQCSIQGIKHSGKARKGDGNDLTPNAKKLVSIGIELDKLNKKINEMTPVSEMPSNVRSSSKREKNKLASRACRLKKKAQHEANKIKLYGLEQEHRALLNLISKVRSDLSQKIEMGFSTHESPASSFISEESMMTESLQDNSVAQQHLSNVIDKACRMRTKQRIAGNTTDFVNKVIETCRLGNSTGGLDELSRTFVKQTIPGAEVNPDHGLYS